MSRKRSIFSVSWSKTQNDDQNRIYHSLTLQTAIIFLLKRVLKNPIKDLNWAAVLEGRQYWEVLGGTTVLPIHDFTPLFSYCF